MFNNCFSIQVGTDGVVILPLRLRVYVKQITICQIRTDISIGQADLGLGWNQISPQSVKDKLAIALSFGLCLISFELCCLTSILSPT